MTHRVTFLLNMLSPYWVPFYERLGQHGWRVSIRVSTVQEPNRNYDATIVQSLTSEGVDCKELPCTVLDLRRLPIKTDFFQIPRHLGGVLEGLSPEVVVSNQLGLRTALAIRWGVRRHIPVIPWINASKHSERRNSLFRERMRRYLVARAPLVFTNGNEGVRYITEALSVPDRAIIKVPYAVDFDTWRTAVHAAREGAHDLRQQLGLSRLVLIYVGQMIPRKGVGLLIDSFHKLSEQERCSFELLALGGDPPASLRKKAVESGVHVVWHPFVQPQVLPRYLAAADALVLPSLEDEWGIVLNEGAAAGLPLLASKFAGATTDLVRNGVNGYIIDPLDSSQTAHCISAYLALDEGQRTRMASASREVAMRHDIGVTVRNAVDALAGLVAR